MSDLVERLRVNAKSWRRKDAFMAREQDEEANINDEAADEIERLTRELSELRLLSTDKATAWDALNAHQRGRRKAFEEAAEIAGHAVWGWRGRSIATTLRSRAEESSK